ncbi:uncharacterized protein LOC110442747 isoform X2 [Mizuhopecten yessoensis]|uniref:Uncharacterized protein n=2 Tax=Mizuhopecten yessoensis TaxID=6573 RepID=A0A210PGM6_MIZYE|nr:uncharacterized protein LOC110442747 isoform X2 [Mizuhopecten yessoensis]XP_021342175.1 uncharacterized protein LOC110442747 isoform X2 [Mizuhopecten yessoensis]OWF35596.1 hypothetical protein KP79_PYT15955 [Mizuhopecten yessoensis]
MADKFDYVRGAAFVVAFFVLGVWSLPSWLIADTVFTAFSGVGLYFRPELTIQLQTHDLKLDILHCHLNRVFGSFLIGSAVVWYFCRLSKDSTVVAALLWSRVMGIFCLLSIIISGHFANRKLFTDKHLWFGVLGNSLWWLANAVQLLKSRPKVREGPNVQSRGITLVCNLNLLMLTLVSLALMAFPLMTTGVKGRKLDKYHLHTAKAVGALVMTFSILMWFVPRFVHKRDVRAVFSGQLLTVVLVYVAKGYMQYTSKILGSDEILGWTLMYLPLLLLPMNGLLLTYRVDTKTAPVTGAETSDSNSQMDKETVQSEAKKES